MAMSPLNTVEVVRVVVLLVWLAVFMDDSALLMLSDGLKVDCLGPSGLGGSGLAGGGNTTLMGRTVGLEMGEFHSDKLAVPLADCGGMGGGAIIVPEIKGDLGIKALRKIYA